jgi:hypothetical protein
MAWKNPTTRSLRQGKVMAHQFIHEIGWLLEGCGCPEGICSSAEVTSLHLSIFLLLFPFHPFTNMSKKSKRQYNSQTKKHTEIMNAHPLRTRSFMQPAPRKQLATNFAICGRERNENASPTSALMRACLYHTQSRNRPALAQLASNPTHCTRIVRKRRKNASFS